MSKICYGCFRPLDEDTAKCPRCGFDAASSQNLPFLPLGAQLQKGRYIVGRKLASNNESTGLLEWQNTVCENPSGMP